MPTIHSMNDTSQNPKFGSLENQVAIETDKYDANAVKNSFEGSDYSYLAEMDLSKTGLETARKLAVKKAAIKGINDPNKVLNKNIVDSTIPGVLAATALSLIGWYYYNVNLKALLPVTSAVGIITSVVIDNKRKKQQLMLREIAEISKASTFIHSQLALNSETGLLSSAAANLKNHETGALAAIQVQYDKEHQEQLSQYRIELEAYKNAKANYDTLLASEEAEYKTQTAESLNQFDINSLKNQIRAVFPSATVSVSSNPSLISVIVNTNFSCYSNINMYSDLEQKIALVKIPNSQYLYYKITSYVCKETLKYSNKISVDVQLSFSIEPKPLESHLAALSEPVPPTRRISTIPSSPDPNKLFDSLFLPMN